MTLSTLFPHDVCAHGGFPTALGVSRVGGVTSGALVVYTNFGVLVDHDGLRLVCEEQYGGSGQPVVVLPTDDVFIAGHFKGIARSEDAGCTLESAPVAGNGLFVREFAQTLSGELYLVTSTGGGTNGVYVSDDIGKSWRLFGPGSKDLFFTGIRVLNGEGDLATVGIDGDSFFLSYYFAADNKWESIALPQFSTDSGFGGQPVLLDCSSTSLHCLVAGTDDNARRIVEVGGDGNTKVVFDQPTAISVIAGYSPAGEMFVGDGVQLLRSSDQRTWTPIFGIDSPTCISRLGEEFFVCSNPYLPDSFLVTKSTDNGGTWSVTIHRFDEIVSLQKCSADSQLSVNCAAPWTQLASDFGIEEIPDAGSPSEGDVQPTDTSKSEVEDSPSAPPKTNPGESGCVTHSPMMPIGGVGGLVILACVMTWVRGGRRVRKV